MLHLLKASPVCKRRKSPAMNNVEHLSMAYSANAALSSSLVSTQTRTFIIAVYSYYVKDLATSFQRNKAISVHKVSLLLNDLEKLHMG